MGESDPARFLSDFYRSDCDPDFVGISTEFDEIRCGSDRQVGSNLLGSFHVFFEYFIKTIGFQTICHI